MDEIFPVLVWIIIGIIVVVIKSKTKQKAPVKKNTSAAPDAKPRPAQATVPNPDKILPPDNGWDMAHTQPMPSSEGVDPCHEEQFKELDRITSEPVPDTPEGITSAEAQELLRGVVMSEILRRKPPLRPY